ncbi:MAG: ABC transporter ATP-binding protein, partial [Chloroflexi bacterium]
GVAFEQPNHFLKLTALENLRYFAALYSHRTLVPLDLLRSVGLEEEGDLLVGQYSKGMKNRLTVARALLNDPDLLFLDEPTSGLDPVNARKIKELIEAQKAAGKTVFLTTHNMAVADELCDRVAFLVDGQIRLIDTPHALKLQHGRRVVRVEYRNGAETNSGLKTCDFSLEGLGSNVAFLSVLSDQRIETIHTQEATLEDIFIQVTGRRLL